PLGRKIDAVAAYGRLPLAFEANRGQTDPRVRFLARGPGYTLFLTSPDAVLALAAGANSPALRMRLVGAATTAAHGRKRLAGTTNYYLGDDPRAWRTGIANYGEIDYDNLYPGIGLRYYGTQGRLESDFIVAPGADPGLIRLALDGAESYRITAAGDLRITLKPESAGVVTLGRPRVYQSIGGRRRALPGGFRLIGREVRFQVGAYDRSRPLIIDPTLSYSYGAPGGFATLVGPTGQNFAPYLPSLSVDGTGQAVIVGLTQVASFPSTAVATPPFPSTGPGAFSVYVTKLNAAGAGVVYTDFLGGTSGEQSALAAADGNGDIYIGGVTYSSDFPAPNGMVTSPPSTTPGYLVKLNATGQVQWATYLGGSMSIYGLATDANANVYVGGSDNPSDLTLVNPLQSTCTSGTTCIDGFVEEIAANGKAVLYGTAFGGSYTTEVNALTVDAGGDIYLGGITHAGDLPTTSNALQPQCPGGPVGTPPQCGVGAGDFVGWIAELNPAIQGVNQLLFSSYLGGSLVHSSSVSALAVDQNSPPNLYVLGTDRCCLPTTPGVFQPFYGWNGSLTPGFAGEPFVLKLPTATPNAPAYWTYLSGTGTNDDEPMAIAVDAAGDAWVAGTTFSADYPTLNGPIPTFPGVEPAGFVSELSPTGSDVLYSTFLGGKEQDYASGLALGGDGSVYVAGATDSSDFPTTAGAFGTTSCSGAPCLLPNGYEVYIAKLAAQPAPAAPVVSFTFQGSPVGPKAPISLSGFEFVTQHPVVTIANTAAQGPPLIVSKVVAGSASGDYFGASLDTCQSIGGPVPIYPGQSCQVTFDWEPPAGGADPGVLQVFDNASNLATPQAIPINATGLNGPQASVSPSALDFPNTTDGSSSSLAITVANTGNQPLVLSSVGIAGNNDFTIAPSPTCAAGTQLPAGGGGGSCQINVVFTPTAPSGTVETAMLTIADNSIAPPGTSQTVQLSGVGIAPQALLATSPAGALSGLAFGGIGVGAASPAQSFRISSQGSLALNITSVSVVSTAGNAADFAETDNCAGASLPEYFSCGVQVVFQPSAPAGTVESAAILIQTNAANGPDFEIPLTGAAATLAAQPLPEMVSVDNEVPPQPASQGGFGGVLSADGAEVAFTANLYNSNLPEGGTVNASGTRGLFIRRTCNGAAPGCGQLTQFVAYGPTGSACVFGNLGFNQGASKPLISPDGRFVAFNDDACQNTGGYGPSPTITYLRDLQAGTTTMPLGGAGANQFTMSGDARFFAYSAGGQIYLQDTCLSAGAAVAGCASGTTLVSQGPGSQNVADNSGSAFLAAISPDGRYVAFDSPGTNLLGAATDPNINGSTTQTYLRDTCIGAPSGCTPATILVSADNAGHAGNAGSVVGGVSQGGRYVAFLSSATNLPGAPSALGAGGSEVYLRDTCIGAPSGCTPATTLLSLDYTQTPPAAAAWMFNGADYGSASSGVSLSADGRIVAFDSIQPLTAAAAGISDALYAYDTCNANGAPVANCTPSLHAVSAVLQNGATVLTGGFGPIDPTGQAVIYFEGFPSEIWMNSTGLTLSAAPRILTTSLPGGTGGRSYSQSLATAGGTGTITFSVTAGGLPPGLALDAKAGTISGTPSQQGTFNFTITATDSLGLTGSQAYQVAIACPTIDFLALPAIAVGGLPQTISFPVSLTTGQLAGAIQFAATATDAQSLGPSGTPNTFARFLTVTGSGAPPGMTFSNSTLVLSGTPTTAGTFTLDLTAAGGGCSADSGNAFVFDVTTPCAAQVAAGVSLSGYSKRFGTTLYSQIVTITYTGAAPLNGPLYYVIAGLTSGVSVTTAAGTTTCNAPGSPYMLISSGPVAPGASFQIVVQFNDPSGAGIRYAGSVVGGGTP
ncbi:MAG TPA: choice-of-anchor D domain-containing protein, partial [Terriglobales bacterium]|nr:choice-of-anchor D domain-containing protein [Terriglobales bacterium]